MYSNIIITLTLLILSSVLIFHYTKRNKNICLLFIAQPLVMAGSPVIVFIGGILSSKMTSDTSLATLPITLMILGVASASIPAALTAQKMGRKFAAITGFCLAFVACLIAMISSLIMSFTLFAIASLCFGFSGAFVQQLRFAAIESTHNKSDIPKVLSILMLSGLFAAFLGPEIALAAQHLIKSPVGFAGSFLLLAAFVVIAIIIMLFFKNADMLVEEKSQNARPLSQIIKQPIFIIAITSAAIGYALMSYLMTATPLSMHHFHGHSLQDTKWVIQSHIAAMFIPSIITPWLVKHFGIKSLLLAGTLIYGVVAIIALSGEQLMHYWWALILLGIGWNFLFLTGTTLLPMSYQNNERHKVQAANEFILFGFQASASLLAGWVLFKAGWTVLVFTSLPFVLLLLITTAYFYRLKFNS
jgi:MFS family permease